MIGEGTAASAGEPGDTTSAVREMTVFRSVMRFRTRWGMKSAEIRRREMKRRRVDRLGSSEGWRVGGGVDSWIMGGGGEVEGLSFTLLTERRRMVVVGRDMMMDLAYKLRREGTDGGNRDGRLFEA